MEILASILQITFILFIIRTITMFISSISMSKRMKDAMKNNQAGNTDSRTNSVGEDAQKPAAIVIEMVKDQLCGTLVQRDKAYIVRTDGENHYFCSWECRERFAEQTGN